MRVPFRRFSWAGFFVGLTPLLFGVPAFAQVGEAGPSQEPLEETEPERRKRLTLTEVVERAERESPEVKAALALRTTAEANHAFARMPPIRNPILNLRAMVGRPDDPAATYAVNVGLPFDLTARRRLRSKEADLRIREADEALAMAQNRARALALSAAVRVASAEDALENAEARLAIAERLLSSVRERLASQAVTVLDLSLAEEEVAVARANALAQRRDLEMARDDLRASLDLDPLDVVAIERLSPPEAPDGLTIREAVALASERRRDAQVLFAAAQRLGVSEKRLRAESIAPLILGAEYEQQGNTSPRSSWGATAMIELPLFWRNQGERAVARAEAGLFSELGLLAERAVEREAAAAYRSLHQHLTELETLESTALPATAKTLELTEHLLQAGAAELYRVLLARRAVFELRQRRIALLRDAWLARVSLDWAIGGRWR